MNDARFLELYAEEEEEEKEKEEMEDNAGFDSEQAAENISRSWELSEACQACLHGLRSCEAHCLLGGFGLQHVTSGSDAAQYYQHSHSVCSKHCHPMQLGQDEASCLCRSDRCSECKWAPPRFGFVVGTTALGVVSGEFNSKQRYITLLRRALGPGMERDHARRDLAMTRSQGACMACGVAQGVQDHWRASHMPRRLVDVRAWALVDTSRLCAECYSAAGNYAIVSHAWGPRLNHKQVNFSISMLNTGWQPRFRSDTGVGLEDAVRQASACYGTDYVWIDSLCVDQTKTEDVQDHLMNMSHYYMTAKGCLAVASSNMGAPEDLEYDGTRFWLYPSSVMDEWYTRAWTLPEMLKCRECWLLVELEVCVNMSSIVQLATQLGTRPTWMGDSLYRVAKAIDAVGLQHTYASVMYMLQTRYASSNDQLIMSARAVLGCTGTVKQGAHPDYIVAVTVDELVKSGDTTWLSWFGASGNTRPWACLLPNAHAGYSWLSLTYGVHIFTDAVTIQSTAGESYKLRLMMENTGSVVGIAAYGVFAADQIVKYIVSGQQFGNPTELLCEALWHVYGDGVGPDTLVRLPPWNWNVPARHQLHITLRAIGQIAQEEGTKLHAAASKLSAFGVSTVTLCKIKLAHGKFKIGVVEKPVPLGTLAMRVDGSSNKGHSMLLYCSSSGHTLHRIAAGVGYFSHRGHYKSYLVG